MLINDDCLSAFSKIETASIDMVYLDPPFFTQKKQSLKNSQGKEYEFSDIWGSRNEYIFFMSERLLEI